MSKTLAVLGSPIDHSKSPQIQLAALAALGVDATFERYDVSDLATFLENHRGFDALSLTMPLKEQALAVANWHDPIAIRAKSANYLLRGSQGWHAFNTDVFGIHKATEHLKAETVGILGTGATARSALVAMAVSDLRLWGRNTGLAQTLANDYGAEATDLKSVLSCDLVISTLPGDSLAGLVGISQRGVLLDAVYSRPSPTGFAGYISGLQMLVWQAIGQLRLLINNANAPLTGEEQLASVMVEAAEMAE
jgi:shikimate dehydrogenase